MRQVTVLIILATLFMVGATARAGDIRVTGQFVSEATSGPPLVVNSGDKVPGLNSDMLDGMTAADFATVTELATPDSGVTVHYKNLQDIPGLEITQNCAEVSGCFSGDSGGFPVTITEPGSYRLASNLDVSALSDPDVIQIQASNVTLDLNGFAIIGPVTCSGTPVTSCNPSSGTGIGIHVSTGLSDLTIRNGSVRGQTQMGILCESSCLLQNITASENRIHAFASIPVPSQASNCNASRNGHIGFFFAGNVDNSVAYGNADHGIQAVGAITNNIANNNGGSGIVSSLGSAINNTAYDNVGTGLHVTGTARGNTAKNNGIDGLNVTGTAVGNYSASNTGDGLSGSGSFLENESHNNDGNGINAIGPITANSIRNNQADGILAGRSSKVSDNNVIGNSGDAIECSAYCLVLDNAIFDNSGAALHGSDTVLLVWGRNYLRNNAGTGSDVLGNTLSHGDNVCDTAFC